MKSTFLKSILFVALSAGFATSCVNDDDYETPDLVCEDPGLVANKTVQEVFDAATATPTLYTADDVIEAYVVSSDRGGNFFKTLYLQSTDNALGFSVLIDYANYATIVQPGRKVFIKLKDRHFQIKDGGLLIGQLDGSSIFRIPAAKVTEVVKRTCAAPVDEETLVQRITIDEALASNDYLNMLVEFENVQFAQSAVGLPYYQTTSGSAGTNYQLLDTEGNAITVRTTDFSEYAANIVPGNSGNVRGILSRFGTTFQFSPRYESDIKLTEERFYINTQLGGTALVYNGTLNETFETYPVNNRIFAGYINDAYVGSRYWEIKSFSSNEYIQMSSNQSNEVNRALFFVPVDFTTANTLQFKTKDGFNNGAVLKVYYTTNYTPATDISTATLVDITSQFTIASGTTSGYAVNFTNSGVYNIPASVTGNGFIIFEYAGTGVAPIVTTTMQIDDIVIN